MMSGFIKALSPEHRASYFHYLGAIRLPWLSRGLGEEPQRARALFSCHLDLALRTGRSPIDLLASELSLHLCLPLHQHGA